MRRFPTVAILAMSIALASCATTGRITSDSDPSQNFSAYKTFAWAGEKPMITSGDRVIPGLIQSQVSQAIKSDLSSRGYRFTDDLTDADFAVSFTIGTREGIRTSQVPDYFWQNRMDWGWGSYYFPRRRPLTTPIRTVLRDYTEGTLSVDIYDVKRKSPVWHGKGTKTLGRKELSGEQNTAAQDVRLILAGFPPS